ncbi:MAG: bifunctional 2-polyprenyl-6-hydroxyphenol methylase/3-demethylubiquinol 3-O-methyltransferase UbiG, partial [Alphaproteobacteria bacterium]|nr:bifunctional 2-polyprenyl-6-hydroxyphenol methylase/3-demethylubiquinol 3-O-methyltransferase UbiG [Alphaproteobacteria bacterium]
PLQGIRLLDIGCGGGLLCEPMARLGADVTGVDASAKNIGTAALHAGQMGLEITYRATTAEDLLKEGAQFDAVLNMEVVEHVADVGLFMSACAGLLKPGGVMVCATLSRTLKSLALAKIGAEYILGWLPKGTHDWRKFLTPAELAGHLRANGLSLKQAQGVSYNPLRDQWALSTDTDVNYMLVAEKPAAD